MEELGSEYQETINSLALIKDRQQHVTSVVCHILVAKGKLSSLVLGLISDNEAFLSQSGQAWERPWLMMVPEMTLKQQTQGGVFLTKGWAPLGSHSIAPPRLQGHENLPQSLGVSCWLWTVCFAMQLP